ncbi:MAG: hypothetical protein GY751_22905 [Bacteroidetes bacterium]|nr:hypothetical protein [Bacteroidota bacterium]
MIGEITQFAERIANGEETVTPGTPTRFTEASTIGDRIWQGDLALTIMPKTSPKNYKKISQKDFLKINNLQLVHGSNKGSKHCIDSLEGVEINIPEDWNAESLDGPFLTLTKERTVTHPVHGDVTIPAGFSVACTYQREYDTEQRRERRARD